MNPKTKQAKAQKLAAELQLARFQQTKVESTLNNAKERAQLAKRRRKEAKQAFRRARKEVKRVKVELAKAKEVIIETEARLAEATKALAKERGKSTKRTTAYYRIGEQKRPARNAATAARGKRRKEPSTLIPAGTSPNTARQAEETELRASPTIH